MNDKHLLDHIKEYRPAVEFLSKNSNKVFTVNSFKRFAKCYWDKSSHDGEGGGAKFSERVFSMWIYNEFIKNNEKIEEIFPQKKYPLKMKINGAKNIIKKDADLFIKSNRNEIIIEFKCNIDMIEKDLFKLMLAPRKYKKILFIWEKRDNSKKAKSDKESSYITILKYAKEKKWIDEYFYFPLLGKNGRKVAPSRLKKEIEKFKLSIKSYINAA